MLNVLFHHYCQRRARQFLSQDDYANQRALFRTLMRRIAGTKFGRHYQLDETSTLQDYQERVPLFDYETLSHNYFQDGHPPAKGVLWHENIPYVALSSGSTKVASKELPLSREMVASNERAAWDVMAIHSLHAPPLDMSGGISFMLGGSTDFKQQGARAIGDLSAIAHKNVPRFLKKRVFPPDDLAFISDWQEKINLLSARIAPSRHRVTLLSGAPSWMLVLLEKLREQCDDDIPFPNLRLLIHGGMAWTHYHKRFSELVANINQVRREVYAASEGFIALADGIMDNNPYPPLRLLTRHGVFYEFVECDKAHDPHAPAFTLETVKPAQDYAIVVSSMAGLWRYVMGDVIRFTSLVPPRITVQGRLAWTLSALGEHVTGSEIERALNHALTQLPHLGQILEYTVGFEWLAQGKARHVYVIECQGKVQKKDADKFSSLIDKNLQKGNDDYATHRLKDISLAMPRTYIVTQGTFLAWMQQRGKAGGQNKVPRVITDEHLFSNLLTMIKEYRGTVIQ